MSNIRKLIIVSAISLSFIGCASSPTNQVLEGNKSQVEARNYQTRSFDTNNKAKTLRTVISTLQDLGFVMDKADQTLGTVTATKFTSGVALKMSVSVRPKGEKQLLVRANAQYGIRAVEDPESYRDFFTSLSKAMFLEAHEIV